MDDEDEKNGEPQEYEAMDADSSAYCIAFIIVIWFLDFIYVTIQIKKYYALRVSNCYGTTFDLDCDLGSHK